MIVLKEQFNPGFDPLPAYRQYQTDYPQDRGVDLSIGRILLTRDDKAGLSHLARASEQLELVPLACQLAGSYALSKGDSGLVEEWRRRAEQYADIEIIGHKERATLAVNDTLKQAGISQDARADLQRQLQTIAQVQHAWICEKAVRLFSAQPLYVLAVQLNGFMDHTEQNELRKVLTTAIRYPSETFVVLAVGDERAMAEKVKAVGLQVV